MKSILKKMIVLGAIIPLAMVLVACSDDGSAEKAGKEIDKAFDSVKEKVHEATE